jgi:hypothetical protein
MIEEHDVDIVGVCFSSGSSPVDCSTCDLVCTCSMWMQPHYLSGVPNIHVGIQEEIPKRCVSTLYGLHIDWITCSKLIHHSRLNNKHSWRDAFDNLHFDNE